MFQPCLFQFSSNYPTHKKLIATFALCRIALRQHPVKSLKNYSYLIHTISKEKAKPARGESANTEIIEKILKESGIKGVVVNSRTINASRKKYWLLKSKVEQMSYFVGIEFDMETSKVLVLV